MTVFLLLLSFILLVLCGYLVAGVWNFVANKDKSFLDMNLKLMTIITMIVGLILLLVRVYYV